MLYVSGPLVPKKLSALTTLAPIQVFLVDYSRSSDRRGGGRKCWHDPWQRNTSSHGSFLHCCLSVSEYIHVLYTYMYDVLKHHVYIWYVRHNFIVYLWLWPQYYDSMLNSCSLQRNCSKEKKGSTNPLKLTNLPRNNKNSGSYLHIKYTYTIRIPLSVPMTKQVARHFSLPFKPT